MSRLYIFEETQPQSATVASSDPATIVDTLHLLGVRFERWKPRVELAPGAAPEAVIGAYRKDIDRLMQAGGYRAVDVISLSPDHPERDVLRQRFLNEHTHAEDEVRFFVAGSGLFTLHIDTRIYQVLCEAGDLISVPANTRHWFDMGPAPFFVAIRLFTNPEGWVAHFTNDDIASRFPRFESALA